MNDFLAKIKTEYNEQDYLLIKYAYEFAQECHKGQYRASGEDYIIHPVAVAEILVDLGLDTDTVIAALLHDTIEDTKVTADDIKLKFGQNIASLVEGVTKLTRLNVKSNEEEQAENIRKLFFAMAKDIRVLLVKLADRLHNMRTLDYLPPEKQIKKSKETLDIYAPLAGRLGISSIKCELEDLSMKYIYFEDYKFLQEKLSAQRDMRMVLVNRVADELRTQLDDLHIRYEIKGRPKHFYSIFKKMKNQGKSFEQIYDLVAVRVIVEDIRDCYTVLGIIHSMWKPIPGRFKDYIAMPKPNLYQSLHTTVVTNFGQIFEIQIRTFEMNRIAEYGIAAHWKYKEGVTDSKTTDLDKKLGWIKEVMDVQGDLKDSLEFIDTLKLNVSTNEIYVFTPKGSVLDLAVGSTCIDFAYRVHSAVGNKCIGAKVNNKMVPVNTVLQNGDMVEIITSNASKGPSRDWLKFIVTPTAKAKIRSFFKKAMKEDNIKLGKEMLEHEAKRKGYELCDLLSPSWVNIVLDRYNFSSVEDMLASIGYGGTTTNQILFKLIDFYKKDMELKTDEVVNPVLPSANKPRRTHSGIIIDGYDDFLIKISHCCNPVPGDEIIGYISRGRGIMVHRADCPNMKNVEKERIIKANWAMANDSLFVANIYLEADSRAGILGQISAVLVSQGINMVSMNARTNRQTGIATINFGIEIKSIEELNLMIKKLSGIAGVIEVRRDN